MVTDYSTDIGWGTPNLSPSELAGMNVLELWHYHQGHPGDLVANNAAIIAASEIMHGTGAGGSGWTSGADAQTAMAGIPAASFIANALKENYNVGGGVTKLGSDIGGGLGNEGYPTGSVVGGSGWTGAIGTAGGNTGIDPTLGMGGTGGTGTPNIWSQTENTYDPYTAYLESLGLGQKNYWNPAEQYRASLSYPLTRLQGIQGRMGAEPGFANYAPSSGYFADYAQPYVSNPSNMYSQARNLLSGIMGANQEQRTNMGVSYDPIWTENEYGARSMNSNNVGELQDLVKLALREKLGTTGAGWVAQRLPREQQMWANYQAGGGTNPYWEYIKGKFNL